MVLGTSTSELESTFFVTSLKTIGAKFSWKPDALLDSVNGKRMICYFDCFFLDSIASLSIFQESDAFCAIKRIENLRQFLQKPCKKP